MARRVAQRLARRGDERLAGGVDRAVADRRQLDGDRLLVLDLGDDVAQRRAQRVAHELGLARHPGAQRVLLAARQARDRRRVVGLALDEGQRLQDRVVQVRGEALAHVVVRVLGLLAVSARQRRDQQRRADDDRRGTRDEHEQ